MTITVGDKVSFTERRTYRPYLHSVTGVVVATYGNERYALVERDDGLMDKLVPVSALSVVEAADDIGDTLAVHPDPFKLIADDYESAMLLAEAGNLGVWEP